jgi:hypothetical protein
MSTRTEDDVLTLELQGRERELSTQVLIAEQGRWWTSLPRALFAYCVVIYFGKVLVWDKVLGWGSTRMTIIVVNASSPSYCGACLRLVSAASSPIRASFSDLFPLGSILPFASMSPRTPLSLDTRFESASTRDATALQCHES